jgi:HlyD family secretion protein
MRRPERIAGAAAGSALAALLAACGGGEAPAPRYDAATVTRGDLSVTVEASGTIEPVSTVEVKSKASGEILELGAETGDHVVAGQMLVRIDPRTPRNLVDQAQAELNAAIQRQATAKTQLERGEKLRENAWINQSELEALELEVANTRAQAVAARVALENSRIGLEDTEVRAPSAGTILTRLVERGQVISSPTRDVGGGTLILTMADLTHVRARVRVDETDIGKLAAGTPARVSVAAFPGREFRGRVEKIEPQAVVDQNVTMFAVLIDVGNEEGLLRPGMNVDAVFDVARREGVLLLPVMALRAARDIDATAEILQLDAEQLRKDVGAAPGGAGRARAQPAGDRGAGRGGALGLGRGLWVVAVKDGRDVPTRVETGITDLDRVEITGGLAEGDRVLLLPTASLVEIQQQIQDVASRRGGIPGLTQKPATAGGPQPPPAARER